MRSIAIVLLISFLAIGVFGFVAMGHTGCIMSIATQNSCMQGRDPIDTFASHFKAYKSFSMAALTEILAVALFAVLRVVRRVKRLDTVVRADESRASGRILEKRTVVHKIKQRLLAWLSIQERRDYDDLVIAGA